MSEARDRFLRFTQIKADQQAITELNGLSMEEMLPTLASIGQVNRTRLEGVLVSLVQKANWKRIMFAFKVVDNMAIPSDIPSDFTTADQVSTAMAFVALPRYKPHGFDDANSAAKDVLKVINATSIRQNREYWGLILHTGKLFSATNPTRSPDETSATPVVAAPAGSAVVGISHTHGAGYVYVNGSTAGEMFSVDDRMLCKKYGVEGYLGTPQGSYLHIHKPAPVSRDAWDLGGRAESF